jgi:hypothetical protein
MKKKTLTRRDFLKVAAVTPVIGAVAGSLKIPAAEKPLQKSKVVLIRDENALVSFKKPDAEVVQRMLDEAVTTLVGEKDVTKAWKTLISPDDVVGIKTNIMRYLPTTSEVENAIKKRILDVGVAENNIGIDDRGVRNNPIFKKATALINARPARTHHWSGIGSCIKNYIMFVPKAFEYHGDSCADLATIWKDLNLKDKTKLNILVMLNPQFHTVGPHSYADKYIWEYKGLIVSKDPVAADSTGLRIIEAKRKEYFGEDVPMKTSAKHIRLAETRHGLGVADPAKIELIKLGWEDGILI